MNLINDGWMPVRLRDGSRTWVAPTELTRPDILAFDADRADFNGALAQFVIGLFQTTFAPNNSIEWRKRWSQPPSADELKALFAPVQAFFECEGEGPRFMQDLELTLAPDELLDIGSLLIERPGGNTLKNNTDHFVKRGGIDALCMHCAVTALFTLQINAPPGGVGYRTSVRGGGPLTTLLLSSSSDPNENSLWHSLWLNVMDTARLEAGGGSPERNAPWETFPWLASQQTLQAEGGTVAPEQVHPAHVFWAMPRRIRFAEAEAHEGTCDLCARPTDQVVRSYMTRNQGLNYKGPWRHPLSPYYQTKEALLPLHPQPGGFGYRHWAEWAVGLRTDNRQVEAATTVSHFLASGMGRRTGLRLHIWAFGFDMDNAKARCWYESTLPLYALADCEPLVHAEVSQEVAGWVAGAETAMRLLRDAVKACWFSKDARGDFSFVDATFWSATEAQFYRMLEERIHAAQAAVVVDRTEASERWCAYLYKAIQNLFDKEFIGAGAIERENPSRIAQAKKRLMASMPKLRAALGLSVDDRTAKTAAPKKVKQ